jgi:hypothetical protein
MSLKDKLNEADKTLTEQENNAVEAQKALHETIMREFPRLCTELLAMVKRVTAGANGVAITEQSLQVVLQFQAMQPPVTLGAVTVPAFRVAFHGKFVDFRPEGIGYVGAMGKIAVGTNTGLSLNKGGIFMQRTNDPRAWALTLAADTPRGPKGVPITDEIMSEMLEKAFT